MYKNHAKSNGLSYTATLEGITKETEEYSLEVHLIPLSFIAL